MLFDCLDKIEKYIKNEFNHELTEDEKMYLAVHINRITKPN